MKFLNAIIFFLIAQGMIYIIVSIASWDLHTYCWTGPAIGLGVMLTLFNLVALFRPKS